MYSDDWHRKGYEIENPIRLVRPIYYRHAYDRSGNLVGVIVDFEYAHDAHYEFLADAWDRFCGRCLQGADETEALRVMFSAGDPESYSTMEAFEKALKSEGIVYQRISF